MKQPRQPDPAAQRARPGRSAAAHVAPGPAAALAPLGSPRLLAQRHALQRVGLEEEEPLQGAGMEEEEPLQGAALEEEEPLQGAGLEEEEPLQGHGLPPALAAGVQQLAGVAVDDVRVHRGSARPAEVGAAAFAQGADIHLAPGQERHLPHEAWHVAQQRQGRVAPTTTVAGVPVNDNPALEAEADRMGVQALAAGRRVEAGPGGAG
jgi:hypothetical protein